jgi:sporadic carbohydrate cluster 2OG-Fe(II) oxygenase
MKNLKAHFREKGWFVFDLPDPTPIWKTRTFLEQTIARILGTPIALENYHKYVKSDEEHTSIQVQITQGFREQFFGPQILASQASFFERLLGPDLLIQAKPYLRMTRPHKPQDNIGYHRDTFYGGSPFELSVFVPFVNLPPEASLSVLSGSHVHAEDFYPTQQIQNPDEAVRKGSEKHQLGFLYAPKIMDPAIHHKMEAIPLSVGQALVFSLATVHGSIVNTGNVTRWSSDMRIMHALAPVDLSARPDYYKPLSYSVVSECARQYIYANSQEARDEIELELCHTATGK